MGPRTLTRLAVALTFAAPGCPGLAGDARALVAESAGRDAADRVLRRNYTWRETVVERRFDDAGKLRSTEAKVFDVVNLYGRPYQQLIEKDGRPLGPADQVAEQRKIDRELEKRSREPDHARQKRLARDARELDEERAFRREIADAFLFTLVGEEPVSGMPCHVIRAEPKPGFVPRSRDGRVLPKVRGRLWISRDDKRWVKIEAETIDTFSLGWFLLRVAKGTRLHFEAGRVGGEVWMPARMYLRGGARVAAVKKVNLELDVRWSDFRKFSSESRVLGSP